MKVPQVGPKPERQLKTPSGNPAYLKSSQNKIAERGVFSDVFITETQPVARTGANFQESIARGKFHGMICAHTPTASFLVWLTKGPFIGVVVPMILSAHPA